MNSHMNRAYRGATMFSSICRRNVRSLKCVLLVCIIVCLAVSVLLAGGIHASYFNGDKNKTDLYHPRNIAPVLFKHGLNNSQQVESVLKFGKNDADHIKHDIKAKTFNNSDTGFAKNLNISKQTNLTMDEAEPCYNVHAFYYPWYGNPEHDGAYYHWNHQYIEHWNKQEAVKWPKGEHAPPGDVGSNFYPALGAYSSADPQVVDRHMEMMREANIGVVVVSWYPAGDADTQGKEPDSLMSLILDAADKHELKVTIHVEPFKNRDQNTMKDQMRYILSKYGSHPAFYRRNFRDKKNLPLIYIYDSYLTKSKDWAEVLTVNGPGSIRNTDLDAIFIGLWVEAKHGAEIANAGFDGFYTYFATNQFTHGSTWRNWEKLHTFAKSQNMLFVPSVGPGYVDTEVRPWNNQNTRARMNGKYYDESFSNALQHKPDVVSITSFNEWHEGTQIEPAVRKLRPGGKYQDYSPHEPDFYLQKTKHWVDKYRSSGQC